MIKDKELLFDLCKIFVFLEIALGIIIQVFAGLNFISYTIIVLACLFCFFFAEKTKSYIFTQIALICTVGADFFLVLSGKPNQLWGMIFFSGTQIAYFLRIAFEEENISILKKHLILRVSAPILIMIITYLVLGNKADAVAIVSMCYYTNIILNIIFSLVGSKKSSFLKIGLICFVICDTFIGLANIEPYMAISKDSLLYALLYPGFDIAWAFYVPSQILLSLSLLPNQLKKRV